LHHFRRNWSLRDLAGRKHSRCYDRDATRRGGIVDRRLLVGGDLSFQEIVPTIVAWLRRRVPGVCRYGSICTGVFLLAAAGLLDGEKVTTHWECASRLKADYPDIALDADQIFTRDGALSTTAGVTAGMDLALAMVEEDYGRDRALIVARCMVMFSSGRAGSPSSVRISLPRCPGRRRVAHAANRRPLRLHECRGGAKSVRAAAGPRAGRLSTTIPQRAA
jgi:transcriptional regulator GlxA family with amidase domain